MAQGSAVTDKTIDGVGMMVQATDGQILDLEANNGDNSYTASGPMVLKALADGTLKVQYWKGASAVVDTAVVAGEKIGLIKTVWGTNQGSTVTSVKAEYNTPTTVTTNDLS
jgi:hypothetical protein